MANPLHLADAFYPKWLTKEVSNKTFLLEEYFPKNLLFQTLQKKKLHAAFSHSRFHKDLS